MSRASRTSSFVSTSATAKRRRKPPVWLRNVYLKTLRDYRVAILGWGIGMGLVIVSPMASVSELVKTPEARAALVSLAQTFVWNADAIAADTVGGYATFKIGIFIFLIGIWPLLAASRMLRGEEDRSSLDILLSVPRGRVRVAPFADLLLQPQQAPCPEPRRQPGRHARATRSCGRPERGGGLAICPPRRRRYGAPARVVAPLRPCRRPEPLAAGAGLVAPIGL